MSMIVKCVNGHFYDAEKSKECPYCVRQEEKREMIIRELPEHPEIRIRDEGLDEGRTMAMPADREVFLQHGTTDPGAGRVRGISAAEDGVTQGIFCKARGTAYVTGWLVGTGGPVKGRDYRIMSGKNWIGRSYNMDICIAEGAGIAAVNQCAVVYDRRGNQFFVMQGAGTITYLNGGLVKKPEVLKLGDEIKMGNCTFEFVPFCREGHVWEVEDLCGES